ncbi:MAG TPA: hypothetical protein VGO93_14745, partial [Candidatus Xenobia bacterium]|jgi:hypothetical protein
VAKIVKCKTCKCCSIGSSSFCKCSFWHAQNQILDQINAVVHYHSTASHQTCEIVNRGGYLLQFDFNQFISLADQMRVVYWNELDTNIPLGINGPP